MLERSRRVVVTGLGMVTPLGLDVKTTWGNVIAGKSGIAPITLFDASQHVTKFAGEVKGFDATNYVSRKDVRRMDRFAQFAVAASKEAVGSAGLTIDINNKDSIGVIIGSGIGGLTTLYQEMRVEMEQGPKRVSPFLIPMMIADMAASQVSIALGLKGPNLCITTACSSGSDAIGVAYEIIRRGEAKAIIAGGSEAIVNPIGIAAFNALNALSTRNDAPEKASRPFDAERDGFVIGEGAGIMVLEDSDHARVRGAKILAEIIGYGATADAFHITQPSQDGEGAARAIRLALSEARLGVNDIDYINAHGTSTPLNDKTETLAVKSVFGERAYQIPMSSTKSMVGHLIGAAAGVEAIICIMAIQEGIIPPTINLTHPDPACDLDYVPNTARKAELRTVLKSSFGFGGHNSVLIFRRFSEV
ncbi:MAG: beta-ketoacyl-ACP synthase II [Chloroflexota bacterium]